MPCISVVQSRLDAMHKAGNGGEDVNVVVFNQDADVLAVAGQRRIVADEDGQAGEGVQGGSDVEVLPGLHLLTRGVDDVEPLVEGFLEAGDRSLSRTQIWKRSGGLWRVPGRSLGDS